MWAAAIGLRSAQVRWVGLLIVRLVLGGILSGVVLTWVTVASELSATVVLYSGPWTTMTIAMFQALEGTSPGIAASAATVLIVCTLVPVALDLMVC